MRISKRATLAALTAAAVGVMASGGTADDRGNALLAAAFNKLQAATTLKADVTHKVVTPRGEQSFKGTVLAMKPNYFRFELQGPQAPTFVADGKSYFFYSAGAPNYQKLELPPNPKEMMGSWEGEIDAFFGGAEAGKKAEAAITGEEKVNGVDCHLLTVKMTGPDRTVTYAIGKEDAMIYRSVLRMPLQEGQEIVQTNLLSNIRLNEPIEKSKFAFTPPAGVTEFVRPNFREKLIPPGKEAPDFTLPTPSGGTLSLKQGLNRKKALMVNFWFYN